MQNAQGSTTRLKASAIPFPAPPPLPSPSPREEPARFPPVDSPVEPSNDLSKDTKLSESTAAQPSTPSTAQQSPRAGSKAPKQLKQLYSSPPAPEQSPFTSNALGIAFPASAGSVSPQSHATPAPLQSPLRFPASEHPLPPLKTRSMSLGGMMPPLGPSPPLPPPFELSALAPRNATRSFKRSEGLQRVQGGLELSSPGLHPPGAPLPLHHPHLHPSPPALHHHHSVPALPHHPYGFAFPPPPPPPFSSLVGPLYSPPSPAFYSSPPTPQLYPLGPPSLRHHHSFSCSSSHSSQSLDAANFLNFSPITPLNHAFPASPPLLALSATEPERPSNSSTTTTCDVWDCFAPATCEVSPCSCVLCHRHLRILIHGARVVEAGVKTGARAAGSDEDVAAQGRMKKLFECVGCRTQSQAIEKGRKETEEDLVAGLDEFELGSFGVRDLRLSASPTTEATSPPPSPPPPRPRKVTLPSTIIQPAFPLTQAVANRNRSASSPSALDLFESSDPSPPLPFVRARVNSAPFALPGGEVVRRAPASPDFGDSSSSPPSAALPPATNRTILRLDNIPWLVTVAEIAEWLPEDCRPRSEGPSPFDSHRSSSRFTLSGRAISVRAVAHEELMQALFHQLPPDKSKLNHGLDPNFTPRLPSKEDLDLLLRACRKAAAPGRTVSYHPERPFLNIVQLIDKFPWVDKSLWTPFNLHNIFECAEEAASIALLASKRDSVFAHLAERLKSIVITSTVFSPGHKERMRNVKPQVNLPFGDGAASGPVRHRKSFPSHPSAPRPPNGYFHPSSPTSYRPRRGSLLGPNGTARRPSLPGALNGPALFPPLPSRIEHQPTALPLSPPETPTFSDVPLMAAPPQARRSKSAGLLNGKEGWGVKGLQMAEMEEKR